MPTQAFQIQSQSLAERRAISVFVPNDCKCISACPVLFCADGQTVEAFSRRIEREVDEGTLPQIVLVGAHSSQQRFTEYVRGQDESRFRRHQEFFIEELRDWFNMEFGVTLDRNRTAVFGFSHGGAFALTMASRHPGHFSLVVAFSVAGDFEEYQLQGQNCEAISRFYLSAGSKEKPLLRRTRQYATQLKTMKLGCVITERHAGHDFGYWDEELPLALRWGFPLQ